MFYSYFRTRHALTGPDTGSIETGQFNGSALYKKLMYNALKPGIYLEW
jgi:hypothetical protein